MKQPTCIDPDGCDRAAWFTAEGLCRRHGLAAGLGQPVPPDPDELAVDDPLWQPTPSPTPPITTGRARRPRNPRSPS